MIRVRPAKSVEYTHGMPAAATDLARTLKPAASVNVAFDTIGFGDRLNTALKEGEGPRRSQSHQEATPANRLQSAARHLSPRSKPLVSSNRPGSR
jgi:hypothetical protein